jgi:signal transduction histidine kinase
MSKFIKDTQDDRQGDVKDPASSFLSVDTRETEKLARMIKKRDRVFDTLQGTMHTWHQKLRDVKLR